MMTSYIREKYFNGVRCIAMGSRDCKYTAAMQLNGTVRYTAFNTIHSAQNYFMKNEEISKIVLYIYHPKKREFQFVKCFLRE